MDMVRRALRSRRGFRRVKRKTPGGKHVIRYERRKPSEAKCGSCGKKLAGVPRDRPIGMKRLGKAQKRPERPFGGNLCPSCLKSMVKEEKVYKTEA